MTRRSGVQLIMSAAAWLIPVATRHLYSVAATMICATRTLSSQTLSGSICQVGLVDLMAFFEFSSKISDSVYA